MDEPRTTPARLAGAALLGLSPFVLIALLHGPLLGRLVREDGAIEWAGALAWLLAAGLFVATLQAVRRTGADRRAAAAFWLLGLALMSFLAAGEEISWGQRLFDYRTPEAIAELNLQNEMNLHNLVPFDVREADGEAKDGIARWLTFNRIGSLIWMGFLVALPLAYRFVGPLRRLVVALRLPVPSLEVAVAAVTSYAGFVALRAYGDGLTAVDPETSRLLNVSANEVKETVIAVLFAAAAAHVWRATAQVRERRAPLARALGH